METNIKDLSREEGIPFDQLKDFAKLHSREFGYYSSMHAAPTVHYIMNSDTFLRSFKSKHNLLFAHRLICMIDQLSSGGIPVLDFNSCSTLVEIYDLSEIFDEDEWEFLEILNFMIKEGFERVSGNVFKRIKYY